jgi:hypothetical protein
MNRREGGSVPAVAGAGAAMVACCAVHLLVLAGVLAGVSGVAVGGLEAAAGVTAGAAVWGAVLLRRRVRRARAASVGEGSNDAVSGRCRNTRGTGTGTC